MMPGPKHPIWRILEQTIATTIFLGVVLYFSANNFDETEIKTLIILGSYLFGKESLVQFFTKSKSGKKIADSITGSVG